MNKNTNKNQKATQLNGHEYTQALLEDLRDQFQAFGEGLDMVSKQTDRLETHAEETNHQLENVEASFIRVELSVEHIEKEFSFIRQEISELKNLLASKADLARLAALEARVDRLERTTPQPAQ